MRTDSPKLFDQIASSWDRERWASMLLTSNELVATDARQDLSSTLVGFNVPTNEQGRNLITYFFPGHKKGQCDGAPSVDYDYRRLWLDGSMLLS